MNRDELLRLRQGISDYVNSDYYGAGNFDEPTVYQKGQRAFQESQENAERPLGAPSSSGSNLGNNFNSLPVGGDTTTTEGISGFFNSDGALGVLGTFKDSFDAGAYNVFAGTARFLGDTFSSELLNNWADAMKERAAFNQTDQKVLDGSNAKWVANAVGNALGSSVPTMVAFAGLSAAAPELATAGAIGTAGRTALTVANAGSKANTIVNASKALTAAKNFLGIANNNALARLQLARILGNVPEAMAESGGAIEEANKLHQEGFDRAVSKWGTLAGNMAYLTAMDAMGNYGENLMSKAISKQLKKDGSTTVARKVIDDILGGSADTSWKAAAGRAMAFAPVNAPKEGGEEFGQNMIKALAVNGKITDKDLAEALEEAKSGAVGGAFLGGIGGAITTKIGDNNRSFRAGDDFYEVGKTYTDKNGFTQTPYYLNGKEVDDKTFYDSLNKHIANGEKINTGYDAQGEYIGNADKEYLGLSPQQIQAFNEAANGIEQSGLGGTTIERNGKEINLDRDVAYNFNPNRNDVDQAVAEWDRIQRENPELVGSRDLDDITQHRLDARKGVAQELEEERRREEYKKEKASEKPKGTENLTEEEKQRRKEHADKVTKDEDEAKKQNIEGKFYDDNVKRLYSNETFFDNKETADLKKIVESDESEYSLEDKQTALNGAFRRVGVFATYKHTHDGKTRKEVRAEKANNKAVANEQQGKPTEQVQKAEQQTVSAEQIQQPAQQAVEQPVQKPVQAEQTAGKSIIGEILQKFEQEEAQRKTQEKAQEEISQPEVSTVKSETPTVRRTKDGYADKIGGFKGIRAQTNHAKEVTGFHYKNGNIAAYIKKENDGNYSVSANIGKEGGENYKTNRIVEGKHATAPKFKTLDEAENYVSQLTEDNLTLPAGHHAVVSSETTKQNTVETKPKAKAETKPKTETKQAEEKNAKKNAEPKEIKGEYLKNDGKPTKAALGEYKKYPSLTYSEDGVQARAYTGNSEIISIDTKVGTSEYTVSKIKKEKDGSYTDAKLATFNSLEEAEKFVESRTLEDAKAAKAEEDNTARSSVASEEASNEETKAEEIKEQKDDGGYLNVNPHFTAGEQTNDVLRNVGRIFTNTNALYGMNYKQALGAFLRFVDVLSKGNQKVVISPQEYFEALKKAKPNSDIRLENDQIVEYGKELGENGKPKRYLHTGEAIKGVIYLSPADFNLDTPFHEYTHLWWKKMKATDKDLIAEITQTVKQTRMYKEIANDKYYQQEIEEYASSGKNEEEKQKLREEFIADETFARLVGFYSTMRIGSNKKQTEFDNRVLGREASVGRFRRLLNSFVNAVRRLFGKPENKQGVEGLEKYVTAPIRDILEATPENLKQADEIIEANKQEDKTKAESPKENKEEPSEETEKTDAEETDETEESETYDDDEGVIVAGPELDEYGLPRSSVVPAKDDSTSNNSSKVEGVNAENNLVTAKGFKSPDSIKKSKIYAPAIKKVGDQTISNVKFGDSENVENYVYAKRVFDSEGNVDHLEAKKMHTDEKFSQLQAEDVAFHEHALWQLGLDATIDTNGAGFGKTYISTEMIRRLLDAKPDAKILVMCQLDSTMKSWREAMMSPELGRGISYQELKGRESKIEEGKVTLLKYASINNTAALETEWDFIFFDESQNLSSGANGAELVNNQGNDSRYGYWLQLVGKDKNSTKKKPKLHYLSATPMAYFENIQIYEPLFNSDYRKLGNVISSILAKIDKRHGDILHAYLPNLEKLAESMKETVFVPVIKDYESFVNWAWGVDEALNHKLVDKIRKELDKEFNNKGKQTLDQRINGYRKSLKEGQVERQLSVLNSNITEIKAELSYLDQMSKYGEINERDYNELKEKLEVARKEYNDALAKKDKRIEDEDFTLEDVENERKEAAKLKPFPIDNIFTRKKVLDELEAPKNIKIDELFQRLEPITSKRLMTPVIGRMKINKSQKQDKIFLNFIPVVSKLKNKRLINEKLAEEAKRQWNTNGFLYDSTFDSLKKQIETAITNQEEELANRIKKNKNREKYKSDLEAYYNYRILWEEVKDVIRRQHDSQALRDAIEHGQELTKDMIDAYMRVLARAAAIHDALVEMKVLKGRASTSPKDAALSFDKVSFADKDFSTAFDSFFSDFATDSTGLLYAFKSADRLDMEKDTEETADLERNAIPAFRQCLEVLKLIAHCETIKERIKNGIKEKHILAVKFVKALSRNPFELTPENILVMAAHKYQAEKFEQDKADGIRNPEKYITKLRNEVIDDIARSNGIQNPTADDIRIIRADYGPEIGERLFQKFKNDRFIQTRYEELQTKYDNWKTRKESQKLIEKINSFKGKTHQEIAQELLCNDETGLRKDQVIAINGSSSTIANKKTGINKRDELINNFQNGDDDVAICSVDAISEGVSLDDQSRDNNAPLKPRYVAVLAVPSNVFMTEQLVYRVMRQKTRSNSIFQLLTMGSDTELKSYVKFLLHGQITGTLALGDDGSMLCIRLLELLSQATRNETTNLNHFSANEAENTGFKDSILQKISEDETEEQKVERVQKNCEKLQTILEENDKFIRSSVVTDRRRSQQTHKNSLLATSAMLEARNILRLNGIDAALEYLLDQEKEYNAHGNQWSVGGLIFDQRQAEQIRNLKNTGELQSIILESPIMLENDDHYAVVYHGVTRPKKLSNIEAYVIRIFADIPKSKVLASKDFSEQEKKAMASYAYDWIQSQKDNIDDKQYEHYMQAAAASKPLLKYNSKTKQWVFKPINGRAGIPLTTTEAEAIEYILYLDKKYYVDRGKGTSDSTDAYKEGTNSYIDDTKKGIVVKAKRVTKKEKQQAEKKTFDTFFSQYAINNTSFLNTDKFDFAAFLEKKVDGKTCEEAYNELIKKQIELKEKYPFDDDTYAGYMDYNSEICDAKGNIIDNNNYFEEWAKKYGVTKTLKDVFMWETEYRVDHADSNESFKGDTRASVVAAPEEKVEELEKERAKVERKDKGDKERKEYQDHLRKIYLATGYYYDVDGKWKTWIPNSPKDVSSEWLNTNPNQLSKVLLKDIYKNDRLFEECKFLENVEIAVGPATQLEKEYNVDVGSKTLGLYYHKKEAILIPATTFKKYGETQVAKTLFHEVQHAIQENLQFAGGSSGSRALGSIQKAERDTEVCERIAESYVKQLTKFKNNNIIRGEKELLDKVQAAFAQAKDVKLTTTMRKKALASILSDFKNKSYLSDSAYKIHKGEQEARLNEKKEFFNEYDLISLKSIISNFENSEDFRNAPKDVQDAVTFSEKDLQDYWYKDEALVDNAKVHLSSENRQLKEKLRKQLMNALDEAAKNNIKLYNVVQVGNIKGSKPDNFTLYAERGNSKTAVVSNKDLDKAFNELEVVINACEETISKKKKSDNSLRSSVRDFSENISSTVRSAKGETWKDILKEYKENPKSFLEAAYISMVDKNHKLHELDDFYVNNIGRNLSLSDNIYENVQGTAAEATGLTFDIIQGTAKNIQKRNIAWGLTGTENELNEDGTLKQYIDELYKVAETPKGKKFIETYGYEYDENGNKINKEPSVVVAAGVYQTYLKLHEQNTLFNDCWRIRVRNANRRGQRVPLKSDPYKMPNKKDGTPLTIQDVRQVLADAGWEFKTTTLADGTVIREPYANVTNLNQENQHTTILGRDNCIFKKAEHHWREVNRNMQKIACSSGMLNLKVMQYLDQKYPDYCSLIRDFEDTAAADTYFSSLSNGGNGMANVKSNLNAISEEGSNRPVYNPLETATKAIAITANRAVRNRVALKAVNLMEEAMRNARAKNIQLSPDDIPIMPMRERFREKVVNGQKIRVHENEIANPENCIFTVMKDGYRYAYKSQKELYAPITGFSEESLDGLFKFAAGCASALRKGSTMSPSFIVRNFLRDTMFAGVSSENGFVPFVDSFKGLHALLTDEDFRAEYESAGIGQFNFYNDMAQARTNLEDIHYTGMKFSELAAKKKYGKIIKALYDTPELWSSLAESATRAGEYKKAKDKALNGKVNGVMSEADAMRYASICARIVTLDFTRNGIQGRKINRYVPFFNAAIQGSDKMARLLADEKTRLRTLRNLAVYIMAPTLALWVMQMNTDPEKRRKLNAGLKYSNWVIPVGDTWIRIPKPQEAGVTFGSLLEAALDTMYAHDKNAMSKWAAEAWRVIKPEFIPTVIIPMMEWEANYNFFTGRQVVANRLNKLHEELQYTPTTTESSKSLAKIMKEAGMEPLSPLKTDNAIRGLFGTMGYLMWDWLGLLWAPSWYSKPEKDVPEYYPLRDFVVNNNNLSADVTDYYIMATRASKDYDSYGTNKKLVDLASKYGTAIGACNKKIRALDEGVKLKNGPDYSTWTKKQRADEIKKLTLQIQDLAKKAVEVAEQRYGYER